MRSTSQGRGIQPTDQQLIDAGLEKPPKKEASMMERKGNISAVQGTANGVLAK